MTTATSTPLARAARGVLFAVAFTQVGLMTLGPLLKACRALLLALAWVLVATILLTSTPASAASPTTRRIAVIVGANDPPPGRPALRFAHDDANDLADTLQRVGGFAPADVHVMLDPPPRELVEMFESVARTAASAGGDVLFLFYYSGHSDGQSLFPHGEAMPLSDLRARVERLGARIRVGILDTCRGGSWTQSKGLTVGPALRMEDLLNVDTEGTALVSSSSGLENAHEAVDVHGSFFTHYLTAGLRGAADRAGDGNVTLEEAFDYAKERTVAASARLASTPQHPSFDLALRGRQDIVLTVLSSSTSALEVTEAKAPLEVIHLPSGVTVADSAGGSTLHLALPPGRYLVRSVVDGHVYAKEIEVHAGETATLAEGQLEATGSEQLAMKGPEDGDGDADDTDRHASADEPGTKADADKPVEAKTDWRLPSCNGTDPEGTVRASTGCAGVFGARGSVASVGGGMTTQGTGLEISADSEEYWRRGIYSSVWQYKLALGGGGLGLEGTMLGGGGWGFRVPVTDHQGPVFRAGGVGYILGDDAFFASLLEIPQVQAGWQWSRGHAVVEAAATSGAVLTGRYRAWRADTRDLGSGLSYGGHVSLQVPWVRLSASGEQLASGDGLVPIDVAMATLCAVAAPIAICGDAFVEQSQAHTGGAAGTSQFVRTEYVGLTIGFTGER
jgi:hypothetical protein